MPRDSNLVHTRENQSSSTSGIMVDVSQGGFRLDSREPIPTGQIHHFRLDLTGELSPQASLVLVGRSKWCLPDYIDPSTYNVGFEIINMPAEDAHLLQRIFEKYGEQPNSRLVNKNYYPWR